MSWAAAGVTVHIGDASVVLQGVPDASVDALVTDPPAGISFMGRSWDQDHGGRVGWVRAFAAIFRECQRVLRPGAHGLVWALPRTSHWTATALEDAGFEIRDIVHHHFGSGFPKSLDVSKAIDKAAGAEREVVGPAPYRRGRAGQAYSNTRRLSYDYPPGPETAPTTDAARQWQGWGTALKPATEHWILVRKPLAESNVAANVLVYGTGALNIDGCRVPGAPPSVPQPSLNSPTGNVYGFQTGHGRNGEMSTAAGRWPANLVLSHAEGCRPIGTQQVQSTAGVRGKRACALINDDGWQPKIWDCVEDCPVAELDRQSAATKLAPTPSPTSRFFYVAKASSVERSQGLPKGQRNTHPTVKPLQLMRYLCRLITPPGGLILDPFAGSGTTLVAAKAEGFQAIGIEQDSQWLSVIAARCQAVQHQPSLFGEDVDDRGAGSSSFGPASWALRGPAARGRQQGADHAVEALPDTPTN